MVEIIHIYGRNGILQSFLFCGIYNMNFDVGGYLMRDLQFEENGSIFNCRVNGILVKEGKVLLSKLRKDANWTTVGGKVTFGETTEDAILREFREEMGASVTVDRLMGVVELFFDFKGKIFHQYLFVYQLNDVDNSVPVFEGERTMADNPNGICRWFSAQDIGSTPIKPDCLKKFLLSAQPGLIHLCEKDFSNGSVAQGVVTV